MINDRIFTPGLAQVAYLVADEAARKVAVIDPRRDVDAYITWADERDMQIVAILETHVHADFVSGARELAAETGAPIYASRLGEQEFSHEPLDDGTEITVGNVRLRAVWTPGHTPEHMSFLALDPDQGDKPVAIFTGDALFVGEVGRPDLLGEKETLKLSEQLFTTVNKTFRQLGDDVVVYPGHTAGSACGKNIGDAPYTTIGQEKQSNYAFQLDDKDAFIESVLSGMPQPPTYYPTLKKVNKVGPAYLSELPAGESLSTEEVATRQEAGALVIDTRSPQEFGAGHIPGAVSVGAGPNFAAWMGWLAPYDRELILVVDSESSQETFEQVRTELRRIGLDTIAGYLEGGSESWRSENRDISHLPQMSVQDLAADLAKPGNHLTVLDVRSDDEWQNGHISGARHQFVGKLAQGAEASIDKNEQVAVICGSGYRSGVAASLLLARGYHNLINVAGGMGAWTEAQLPIESD